jgi:thiol:disulfide interchange protein
MITLPRFLPIPMAASAAAAAWLLYRQGGTPAFLFGLFAAAALAICLFFAGRMQLRGRPQASFAIILGLVVVVAAVARVPVSPATRVASIAGAEAWSETRVAAELKQGHPVFVYFTADWCLTCKANEAGAIDRDYTRNMFRELGVKVVVGDWTNGDPAITRFLESRGRAGVPLYLWYYPGVSEPRELPQILTPEILREYAVYNPHNPD